MVSVVVIDFFWKELPVQSSQSMLSTYYFSQYIWVRNYVSQL